MNNGGAMRDQSGNTQSGNMKERDMRSASEDMHSRMDEVKGQASTALDKAKDSASSMAGQMKTSMSGMATDASKAFKDAVEDQKTAGAGAIADLAKSARESADGFEAQSPQLAQAVKTMAGKIEQVSNDVKDKTVNDMMESVTDFAHRQPLAFLGFGVVAGIVLSRLLASPSR
jgi:ElaB/YqjD/DUF883 family membrane-anchored ribosome-binding protein